MYSHIYGINAHLSKIDSTKYNDVFPICGGSTETTNHIVKCPGTGRTKLFQATVDVLLELMQKNETDPEIATLVKDYLQLRGKSTMQAVVSPFLPRKYHLLVKYHGKLGWHFFLTVDFSHTVFSYNEIIFLHVECIKW